MARSIAELRKIRAREAKKLLNSQTRKKVRKLSEREKLLLDIRRIKAARRKKALASFKKSASPLVRMGVRQARKVSGFLINYGR